MLMKFERNLKRLRGSYKKLCDIKSVLFALKLYRGGIEGARVVSKRVVCLILTMFMLKLYLKAFR